MQIQKPIDILTVQELHDKLVKLIIEGSGDNYILLPVCSDKDYEADYVLASGSISFGKAVYLEALLPEEDIKASHILHL